MLKIEKGNFIEAKTEAIVNTVNCVGVMGKGIAFEESLS
jgi:O-acetyl-ADP-ribose deacetylase (regulator of RNase III)